MKFGIATRLFLAFAAIAALSLASGGIGWWILKDVETAQTTIVERAMPAVADARLAAEIAGRIVARSPRLTNAATEAEREAEAAALFRLAERLQAALNRSAGYGYSETELETLRVTAERLRENLSAQNALVTVRIDAAGRLADTIAQALEAAQGLSDLSETLVSNAAAGTTAVISNLYELVESEDRIEESLEALDRLYEEDVFLMERMFELRLRASQVGLLLNQLSRAGTDDEVAWIENALGGNLRILTRRVRSISDPVRLRQARELLQKLLGAGAAGPDNASTSGARCWNSTPRSNPSPPTTARSRSLSATSSWSWSGNRSGSPRTPPRARGRRWMRGFSPSSSRPSWCSWSRD